MPYALSSLWSVKPGLVIRAVGLFARREFNAERLTTVVSEIEELSRIMVVDQSEELLFEQITEQLNKLFNVLKVVDFYLAQSVKPEHLLVKELSRIW